MSTYHSLQTTLAKRFSRGFHIERELHVCEGS